jgi:hypothetical protein
LADDISQLSASWTAPPALRAIEKRGYSKKRRNEVVKGRGEIQRRIRIRSPSGWQEPSIQHEL